MNLKVYFQTFPYKKQTDVHIVSENVDGRLHVMRPVQVVFEEYDQTKGSEPTMSFVGTTGHQVLEAFSQALIENGYGKLHDNAAVKAHLEDMRQLVFEFMNTNCPKVIQST